MTVAADRPPLALPSQNQMYAVLMMSCGKWRVRRPHRYLLALVDDFASRPGRTFSSAQLQQSTSIEGPAILAESTASSSAVGNVECVQRVAPDPTIPVPLAEVPLSRLSEIPLGGEHYGNTTLCVLLDMMAQLPMITTVDWSGQDLFNVDPYKLTVSGNEVVRRLFEWAAHQRRLESINLGANALGTRVMHYIIDALKANSSIKRVEFDERGVEAFVLEQFRRALAANVSGKNQRLPAEYVLSEELVALDAVDRKTSADRRELQQLMWEFQGAFGLGVAAAAAAAATQTAASSIAADSTQADAAPTQSDDDLLKAVVLRSFRRSTAECVNGSRGLRGDGSSLFIIDSGVIAATIGGSVVSLGRGDYFGEALETEMYVAGQLSIEQRGSVFQVPHTAVAGLMKTWEAKVAEFLPILKHVAPFQPLPTWVLIRACHEAQRESVPKGNIVVGKGSTFGGLFIVTKGAFMVRGRAKLGRAQVSFTPGDVFGEEAAVSRTGVSSVEIKATEDVNEVIRLTARQVRRQFVPLLRTILAVHAKAYSDAV